MAATILANRPTNHVFVDMENVKKIESSLLEEKTVSFHLFLGPQNKTLDLSVVESLLIHADRVQLIRSPKNGKNALDFVLAYYLGQAAAAEPKAHFHIVSKDQGFDSLVELLKSKKIKAKRHDDWSSLNFHAEHPPIATLPVPTLAKKPLSEDAEKVLSHLQKSPTNRPKKKETLLSQAKNYLGKGATEAMAEKVVAELCRTGHLAFDDKSKVTYLQK